MAIQWLGEVSTAISSTMPPGATLRSASARKPGAPEMVLEGGSIDVNGAGLLLTTEECLLSPVQARNPGMTRAEIERNLSDYLGARTSHLAAQRHRRRRHARPRRRSGALRRARHGGRSVRRRPCGRKLPAAAGESRAAQASRPSRGEAADAPPACIFTACACPPATRTSTSPMGSCWSRHSTIRQTGSRWLRLRNASPIARSQASIAPI